MWRGVNVVVLVILASYMNYILAAPFNEKGMNVRSNATVIPNEIRLLFEKAATDTSTMARDKLKRHKRAIPPAVASKAIEVGADLAAKAAEEMFNKVGEAGDRARDYLENGASVDVQPQNGFMTDDLMALPAYHIETSVDRQEDKEEQSNQQTVTYPMGIGPVMWNGCYGSNYVAGDPCYKERVPSQATCVDMMEGAAFIGVGFDGRGDYSPESRKMSIIQRNCAALSTYHGEDVPDTMNVHGVYETSSDMMTFSSRSEYSTYLQEESGVSGSFLFLSGGMSKAYGRSTTSNTQSFLSIMNIDTIRYEIFKDEVKSSDLSVTFLREFMELPSTYLAENAPFKFQNFIQRWGTHYVKSAEFGGRLQLRKRSEASFYSDVEEFSREAKVDFDSWFSSFHAKESSKSGSSSADQEQFSSMDLEAFGGEAEIAAIISDGGSPSTRTDLVNWISSIKEYPKPFKFLLGPITELLYFRPSDMFPSSDVDWDCNMRADLQVDPDTGKKFYYTTKKEGNITVQETTYCNYHSKEQFILDIKMKRESLEKAVSVYIDEGIIPTLDITVPPGKGNCQIEDRIRQGQDRVGETPSWVKMTSGESFAVIFDLAEDITNGPHGKVINAGMIVQLHYYAGEWLIEDENGKSRLVDGYRNGGSGNINGDVKKISVFGLVMTFIEDKGIFLFQEDDYANSKIWWPELENNLIDHYIARVEWPLSLESDAESKNFLNGAIVHYPCNLLWSNIRIIDLTERGKCIYFTAVSEGPIYLTFASVPRERRTWYFVEISPTSVMLYKANHVLAETLNRNARGLGDPILLQSYFVCLETIPGATLIEYGKFRGKISSRVVYLSFTDTTDSISPQFYSFGSGDKVVSIVKSDLIPRVPPASPQNCGTGTVFNQSLSFCVLDCHHDCHPAHGCMIPESGPPSPSLCNECKDIRNIVGTTFKCTSHCDKALVVIDGKSVCRCYWRQNECVDSCRAGVHPDTGICLNECPDPGQVENANRFGKTGDAVFYEDVEVSYNCYDGYGGGGVITCKAGSWQPGLPECEAGSNQAWREDLRCGQHFLAPNGRDAECNPASNEPCCSDWKWCGNTPAYCECKSCIDYRHAAGQPRESLAWRDDYRCGSDNLAPNGQDAICNPTGDEPCCSSNKWCGNTPEYCQCPGCVDYRGGAPAGDQTLVLAAWRDDFKCGDNYKAPNGLAATCDASSGAPCCSNQDWCGISPNHCECPTCVDYRIRNLLWRDDHRCGRNYPAPIGEPAACDPFSNRPCCSGQSVCGGTVADCECATCVDHRKTQVIVTWRDDNRCGGDYKAANGYTAGCDQKSDKPCCSNNLCGNECFNIL